LNEESVVAQGVRAVPSSAAEPSRARRLFAGWSANLVQMLLGITQQVALVPVFLHFWSGEVLAAWLVLYAVGNLVLIADGGLQLRAINRFLAFRSSADCDGRTGCFYAAMLRIYLGLAGTLVVLLMAVTQFISASTVLGFRGISNFDAAFAVMTAGMLLTVPSALVSGLYRARGLYGRAVRLQNWGVLAGQLGQLIAIAATGSLLAVSIAYVATQVLTAFYFLAIDVRRLFPFLRGLRAKRSPSWVIGQFRRAAPFAVANATELALLNLPMVMVSAFVADRVAVAQWGLTRVIAGLLRSLCVQTTLPIAAELGDDYAAGLTDQLRNLYARGSVFVTIQSSVVVSGLLAFWPDFFALWTHGAVPYNPLLAITLLIGTGVIAPSILALGYANYSNSGDLLVRTKGLQLIVFLLLALVLIPLMGPLGAAIAVVASDIMVQFGVLGFIIIRRTLQRPFRHIALLGAIMIVVVSGGWAFGTIIRSRMPGTGLIWFAGECTLWLIVVLLSGSPMISANFRNKLIAAIPR
jgi:O-antigen/teichoic acid export membrane protein